MSKFKRNGYDHPLRRKGFRGKWKKFRAAWLAKRPLCAHCGRAGNQVDHVKPLHKIAPWDRITLKELLDVKNVQTLCERCHSKKTALENTHKPPPKFCEHGYPMGVCCQATPV